MIFAYILSVVLMILLPVGLAAWLRRAATPAWLLFGLGALAFALTQAVHLPLNDGLEKLGWLPAESLDELPLWRTALTLGLTAGLCESLARAGAYLFLRKVRPAWLRLPDAVMLGLGHGGFEAMIFGGVLTAATVSALLPLVGVDLSGLGLPAEQMDVLQAQLQALTGSPFSAAAPLLERLLAMSAHVFLSLMVWKAFARGQFRRDWPYLLLAMLYHTAIDAVAVWAGQTFTGQTGLTLLVFAAALLPGWAWALRLVQQERAAVARPVLTSMRAEMGVFWAATRKELRQAWRTKRILVVGAVFLIFGMGSPLLAKFTPEILKSVEGAEMFANLIPEPTAADAMLQYIENISQFGFILAVVLGMGAVVGEKERGVAPMILSKPMPRWAFITSKFAAQTVVYLLGFGLAWIGAYYYTIILFGGLDFGGFALLNGLLLLWLLTFVGLSLVGSTLGASTAAAGGIGLLLSVALMLAGSLPRYGALFPGALLKWATLVGQAASGLATSNPLMALAGGTAAAQGGAAASALVVVVLSLVLAVGIFEQQEL